MKNTVSYSILEPYFIKVCYEYILKTPSTINYAMLLLLIYNVTCNVTNYAMLQIMQCYNTTLCTNKVKKINSCEN